MAKETIKTMHERDISAERTRSRAVGIIAKAFCYAFLIFMELVVLFPFYWMVLTSLKDYGAYNSEYIPRFFTLYPTLANYAEAFTAVPLARYFMNTLLFTVVTTALMLIVITLAAFAFARLEFRGKRIAMVF